MLPSDPKGNRRDNKERKLSKQNSNPGGPSAPSPPSRGSGPPCSPLFSSTPGVGGSRVRSTRGAPQPQVLQSPGLASRPPGVWQSLRAAAPALHLTPGSKSFPPRRDARNANNQPSAPCLGRAGGWGGGDGGEPPGPSLARR